MIVLDASVVIELLRGGPLADSLRRELYRDGDALIAPHLSDIEVLSGLRRLLRDERSDPHHHDQILTALAEFPAERYEHTPFLSRIWELRHNFTAYDAFTSLWRRRPARS